MHIREYQHSDKENLLELLRLNTPQYFSPDERKDFSEYLDTEVESYYVVEEQGNMVGAGGINYFPSQQLARLSWDMIHPDFQGRGIGKQLTLYRIDQIKQQPDIQWIVVRTSQLVYPFYEKMGFTLEKTEKDFWAPGFDLYQLLLALPETATRQS